VPEPCAKQQAKTKVAWISSRLQDREVCPIFGEGLGFSCYSHVSYILFCMVVISRSVPRQAHRSPPLFTERDKAKP